MASTHPSTRTLGPPCEEIAWATHQNDIKRSLSALNSVLKLIQRHAAVLSDLHDVSILLQYSHRQPLVDKVVFGKKDIEGKVSAGYRRIDTVSLQCRYKGCSKIGIRHGRCEVRGD